MHAIVFKGLGRLVQYALCHVIDILFLRYVSTSFSASDLSVNSSSILTNSVNACGSDLIFSSTFSSKVIVLRLAIARCCCSVTVARISSEIIDLPCSL